MAALKCVIFVALCASAIAKTVDIQPCQEYPQDQCTIIQTRIDPCEAPARCVITKGRNVSMAFDFTPNFNAAKVKTMVYGLIGGSFTDFAGFGSDDACTYTSCPLEAGKTQTLNYNMFLEKLIPKGSFSLQWRLWNEENVQQLCCFRMGIRISNKKK